MKSGRSPRVRGSRASTSAVVSLTGSIPAGAGEPAAALAAPTMQGVDPRGCGGAGREGACRLREGGRSPRVRGSPQRLQGVPFRVGSIPAGAGEPEAPVYTVKIARVDPRGCGGAGIGLLPQMASRGRSPRVRGSPSTGLLATLKPRSIPAGAGEPSIAQAKRRSGWVDPRGCGGAAYRRRMDEVARGRSPRVRGSRMR